LNTSDRLHVVSSKMKTTDSRLVWDSTYPLTLYIVDGSGNLGVMPKGKETQFDSSGQGGNDLIQLVFFPLFLLT
jgi:hypothetical protein